MVSSAIGDHMAIAIAEPLVSLPADFRREDSPLERNMERLFSSDDRERAGAVGWLVDNGDALLTSMIAKRALAQKMPGKVREDVHHLLKSLAQKNITGFDKLPNERITYVTTALSMTMSRRRP